MPPPGGVVGRSGVSTERLSEWARRGRAGWEGGRAGEGGGCEGTEGVGEGEWAEASE